MKYISLIFVTGFIGCGGAQDAIPSLDKTPAGPEANAPTNNTADSPSPTPAPIDPGTNRTYTNTFGSSFCNSTSSDFECWGAVADFHTSNHVNAFVMSTSTVCYSNVGVQVTSDPNHAQEIGHISHVVNGVDIGITDMTCYSATLGPILMDANTLSGVNDGNRKSIDGAYISNSGQLCFNVADYNSNNTIGFVFHPCGNTITNTGGVQ